MRTLKFELVEWQRVFPQTNGFTTMQMREFKKQYFKGTAFNAAFPLSNYELPQRWILDGTVTTFDGEECEFSWRPDHVLTFSELIQNSAEAMENAIAAEYAK